MTTSGQLETLQDKGAFQDIAQHFDDNEHAIFASRPTIAPEFIKLIGTAVGFLLLTLMIVGIPLVIFYFVGILSWNFLSMWYIWISFLPLLILPIIFGIFIIGRFFKLIIGYRGSIYIVTNNRIIQRSGSIHRVFLDTKIKDLYDTDVTQTGTQRMFGCGNLLIKGSGGQTWVNIKEPMAAKKMMDEQIKKHGGKRPTASSLLKKDLPPPPRDHLPPPPPPDDEAPKKRKRCPSCGAPIPRAKRHLDHCEYCGMHY